MNIAFYAPLKAVDHPVPSGDRKMARAFLTLLEGLGHNVAIASQLRTLDKAGNRANQQRINARAEAEVRSLGDTYEDGWQPDLWFTYHAYHKAPDLLGPPISRALAIPYIVAEASIAGKQASGPWAEGHRATIEAVNAASAVLAMTKVDASELTQYLTDQAHLHLFPPFLTTTSMNSGIRDDSRRRLAQELDVPANVVWLVTVAMMRSDVKLQSYRLLADSLADLNCGNWRLIVIGNGGEEAVVRDLLHAAAGDKIRFLGQLAATEIAMVLGACDIFVWPALREAYGMAILEALAAGLPVVACDEGGVSDLVCHEQNGLLAQERSPILLRQHLHRLIIDTEARQRFGSEAAKRVLELHSRRAAQLKLGKILTRVDQDHSYPARSVCN